MGTNRSAGGSVAVVPGPRGPATKSPQSVSVGEFGGVGPLVFVANRPPVELIDDGAVSLPSVVDMDLDGDLDVVSAQYFCAKSNPGGGPQGTVTNESFVWFERTGTAADGLDSTDFTKRVIAGGLGESFEILPVDNLDGDG